MPPLNTSKFLKAQPYASHGREFDLALPTMYHTVPDSTDSSRMRNLVISVV